MDELASARRHRGLRLLGAASGACLAAGGIAAYALVGHVGGGSPSAPAPREQARAEGIPPIVSPAGLARKAGIRILHVALTGGGGLLDLRYQVLDPDLAASVHESQPELVDETTGAVVDQLLMGHRHKGPLHAGRSYYLIFENPGNLVRRGSRVTVALGGLRVRHVLVQ